MKRKIALLLAAVIFFTSVPFSGEINNVYAADDIIAYVSGDGDTKSYTSFSSLASDVENKFAGKTITIEMAKSWNAAGSDDYNRRLFIPKKSRVTLNMHGLVFNRNNGWKGNYGTKGELFYVDDNATLTINGGSESERNSHSFDQVATYVETDPSGKKANGRVTFSGGLLTGGCSSDGSGGIHVKDNATVILNDVIIAGCGQSNYGKGGGIWMKGSDSTLRMNNSRVTGCWSSKYGGGVEASGTGTTVELNNSRIDHNYAINYGGGLCIDGEKIHITGRNASKIDSNRCEDYGGGVYINENDTSVSGLEVSHNAAEYGGGIYPNDENITLSDLVIKNNAVSKDGGGIYIYKEHDTISSCNIFSNSANRDGGGVFVYKNIDNGFSVTGKTIVKNNSAKGMGNQFHISDSAPEDTRVNFSLTKGAEVYVSYSGISSSKNSVMVTEGKANDTIKTPNCIQYLHPSNAGFHFAYNASPNMRKIFYVRDGKDSDSTGTPYVAPGVPVKVAVSDANDASHKGGGGGTKAGIVAQVGPGGSEGTGYDLIRAFSHHESTDSDVEDTDNVFFYSDAFFDQDPKVYNEHLATTSLAMAFSGMYLRALEAEDANGNTYYNKHAGARQFMADIGCPDNNIYVNDSNEKVPGTDTIGVTIASKELARSNGDKTGYILIPIAVRGGGYEREWASNATIGYGSDGEILKEAQGFSEAAEQVTAEIDKYITKYGLNDEIAEGKVKFWISGYSRAGATSNLTAKRLVEKYCTGETGKNNQVFAYTWEAPMGGTEQCEQLSNKESYYCIHNMVNAVDIVPLVAPGLMGFKRYGVDHYIPGTATGEVKSSSYETFRHSAGVAQTIQTTNLADNDFRYINGNVTSAEKKKMLAHLKAIDSGIVYDDYFHPMAMDMAFGMKIYENGDYSNNHVESFIRDFMRYAQEGTSPTENGHWSQAVPNRISFVDNVQKALRESLALIFSMSGDDSAGFVGRASSIMDKLNLTSGKVSKIDIYWYIVGGTGWAIDRSDLGWHRQSAEKKQTYTDFFWNKIDETGAFEFLDSTERAKLEKNWPNLANMIFTLAEADYAYKPANNNLGKEWAGGSDESMMLLATFASYASYILLNHYPEVNLAWARTFDSYYDNEFTEYGIDNSGYTISSPSASVKDTELEEGVGKTNAFSGDQKVILDVKDIVGEAVYYDLKDETNSRILATNLLYRGSVDLTLGEENTRNYSITTYAISYGVKSAKATYNISLSDKKHKVTVDNGTKTAEYSYEEGDKVTLISSVPDDGIFKYWAIEFFDKDGKSTGDVSAEFLGVDSQQSSLVLDMPREGAKYTDTVTENSFTVPEGYSMAVTCKYMLRISNVKVSSLVDTGLTPVKDAELVHYAKLTMVRGDGTGEDAVYLPQREYPISWSYKDDQGRICPVSYETDSSGTIDAQNVLPGTVYIATLHVSENIDKNMAFVPTAKLSATLDDSDKDNASSVTISRNDGDGSATVVITFKPTEASAEPVPEPVAETVKITVKTLDVNNMENGEGTDYYAEKGTKINIVAPDVADELFSEWDLGNKLNPLSDEDKVKKVATISIPENLEGTELVITAKYYPVINSVDICLDAPAKGKKLQTAALDEADKATMKVSISNNYVVDPDFVQISWTPGNSESGGTDQIAEAGTAYTAAVSLVPQNDDNNEQFIMAKQPGTDEYIKMSAKVAFSTYPTVRVNGQTALLDSSNMRVSYTFDKTEEANYNLVSITDPENLSGIEYGTDENGIRELLPETVRILLDNGMELDTGVTWTLAHVPGDANGEVDWTCTGSVTLPAGIDNRDNVPLIVVCHIYVDEAPRANSPRSTHESDEYLIDQVIQLTTRQEGGKTYYTLDGSEPTTASTLYNGEDIIISRFDAEHLKDEIFVDDLGNQQPTGKKMIVLKAYTVCEGMLDSEVVTYVYVFDDSVYVPQSDELIYNGEEQYLTGNNDFYSIDTTSIPEGSRIDENGALFATEIGTYAVKLKVNEGYRWKYDVVNEDGTSETRYTAEDQVITITISPRPIDNAEIEIYTNPVAFDHDAGKAEPEITVILDGEIVPPDQYDIIYSDNESPGSEGKVKVRGKGSYTGETIDFTFAICADDASAFTYRILDESELIYTGKKVSPLVQVFYNGITLTDKKDYTIKFYNNKNASDGAYFTIKGKGNYTGKESGRFTIQPKEIYEEDVQVSEILPVVYNGKDQAPVPKITYNKMTLKKGKDFGVFYYSDPSCEGATVSPKDLGRYYAKICATAEGNYDGIRIVPFDIIPADKKSVGKLKVNKISDQFYTGEKIELKSIGLVVKDGKKELKLHEDYEAECYAQDTGKGYVVITGIEKNGYSGQRTVTFNVVGVSLKGAAIEGFAASLEYDGDEKVQNIELKAKMPGSGESVALKEYKDYEIDYMHNTNVGTATMIITGIGGCTGTIKKTFKIVPYDITKGNISVTLDQNAYPYALSGVTPKPVVTFGEDYVLTENRDYKLTYSGNKAVNDGTGNSKPAVKVTGINNFKGVIANTTFTITPANMEDAGIKVTAADVIYKSKAGNWKPKVSVTDPAGKKLKAGKDYDNNIICTYDAEGTNPVTADANVPAGTTIYVKVNAMEGGSYTGYATGSYRVILADRDIGKLTVTVDPKLYTGTSVELSAEDMKFTSKKQPVAGVTFVIDENSYKKNVNKGNATVTIYGTGEWGGKKVVKYKIGARGFLWWFRL